MPERAPNQQTVAMEMLKDYPGHPEGTIAAFPSMEFDPVTGAEIGLTGLAKVLEEKNIARRLVLPSAMQGETPAAGSGNVVVRFAKVWQMYYPGDIAGFNPDTAGKLVKIGAAEYITAADLEKAKPVVGKKGQPEDADLDATLKSPARKRP